MFFFLIFTLVGSFCMTTSDEQRMEWEVLESIYSIDKNFKKICENRLQYKFGCDTEKTFLIEIEWPSDYPLVIPNINLDVFYNSHITDRVRQRIKDQIIELAKENEGMAVSFTLIEYIKENIEKFTEDWESITATNTLGDVKVNEIHQKVEPMTKAAKRRMWARNEGSGLERGWNWVDILKHLAQTKDG